MSLELYITYVLACIVIILVPGPTVTLIIANSIRHGSRAGLANVAGTQAGLAIMIAIEWVKLIGAAYLVWMGVQMFRSKGTLNADGTARKPRGGFFLQGLLVALSNPKTLVFFGAFFPQFIAPQGNYTLQIVVMGLTAMIFAAMSDSTYALAASRAGRLLSANRIKLMSRISGSFLVGGGLWLAFSRSK